MTIGLLVVLVGSALCFPCTVPAATPVHPAATSATGGSGSAALAPHRRHVVPQEASAADAKIWPEFVSLMKSGRISEEHRRSVEARSRVPLVWAGSVPRERIPEIDRSAHLLFSADLNAACPNSVIEALACGLPVVSFDTGALRELVPHSAGRIVPYGADPWKIEQPDIQGLARAAAEVLREPDRFRRGARAQAEAVLGLDRMVDAYLKVLLEGPNTKGTREPEGGEA